MAETPADPEGRSVPAARIRELREAAGLTQKQLAQKAGVHVRSVQNWEKGRGLYGRNIESAAAALGVSTEEILGRRARSDELADVIARVARIERILTSMRGALDDGASDPAALEGLVQEALTNLLAARTGSAAPGRTVATPAARR